MVKIALISDNLTRYSLAIEKDIKIYNITPYNYYLVLELMKPDFLFVESAWQGYKNRWKYKIASYPDVPQRNNNKLKKVVAYAKKLGIPTVFWNKEDGVHFDRFIESAKLFDHIFTVDENYIPKYKAVIDSNTSVNTLMFAVQPKFHYFDGFNFKYNRANFVGSYSKHIHPKRRMWQEMMFKSATETELGLTVFDRNSDRKSENYRYPYFDNFEVKSAVPYEQTAQIYKDYTVSLNVNTIENSPTMFSRRLIEILACGGIAITNPSKSVDTMFKAYCHIVSSKEEMDELFYRIQKFGLNQEDKEMARAGAEYITKNHTWEHRLKEIKEVIGLK